MTSYEVYLIIFITAYGTVRHYIGYTRCLDIRRAWHIWNSPAWLKPGLHDKNQWEYSVLEGGISSKQEALCAEAWWAAIQISAHPLTARGGPWSKPSLSDAMWQQIKEAAKAGSYQDLFDIAAQCPTGALARHLRDISFSVSAKGDESLSAKRKPGRSGTAGNKSRKDQIRDGCSNAALGTSSCLSGIGKSNTHSLTV